MIKMPEICTICQMVCIQAIFSKFNWNPIYFDSDGNVMGNFEKGDKGRMIFGRRAERKFNRIEKRNNEK